MPVKQHGGGQPRQPPRRRLRPLPGPGDVRELVACSHQVAVDVAGPFGRQLTGDDRDHRLVEQPCAPARVAELDQRPAFAHEAHRPQAGVVVAASDPLHRTCGSGDRREIVALEPALDVQDVAHVAVLRPFRQRLEQALCTTEPARPRRPFASQEQRHGQLQRRHRGRARPVRVKVRPVRVVTNLQELVDPSQPPRGVAERRQVPGRQRGRRAGRRELLVGAGPVLPMVRITG